MASPTQMEFDLQNQLSLEDTICMIVSQETLTTNSEGCDYVTLRRLHTYLMAETLVSLNRYLESPQGYMTY